MYLLFCDESGSVDDPKTKYFVLAGISVFERQSYWISSKLDDIARTFDPADPLSIELHGNPMYKGKGSWRYIERDQRIETMKAALNVLAGSHMSNRVFACVIDKGKASPRSAVEIAFEHIASRFDLYLLRLHRQNDTQRGLIIFDNTTYENSIQSWTTHFRAEGHTWGRLTNFAEVPLFIDSKASRLIQMADLVAYSVFQKYEFGNDTFYNIIEDRIDSEGGIRHGLYELV